MFHAMHYNLQDRSIVIPNTVLGSLAIDKIEAKQLYINNETNEFLLKGPFMMNNFTLFSPSTLKSRDKQ